MATQPAWTGSGPIPEYLKSYYSTASAPQTAPMGNPQLDGLYAGQGKPGGLAGGLVDQQGVNYWTGRQATGENITGAFNSSAQSTYSDMLAGKQTPQTSANIIGYNNLLGGAQHPGSYANNVSSSTPYQAPTPQADSSPYATIQAGGSSAAPSSASLTAYSQNPHLKQMGMDLQHQFRDSLLEETLPGVRGGALVAGGIGGSRQAIAEGLATGKSNTGAANAVTNLYGQDYENQMRRNLEQYKADQQFALGKDNINLGFSNQANQYDLGRRGIDLGFQNSDNSYDLGRRNNDLGFNNSGQQFALGIGNLGLQHKNSDQSYDLGQQGLNNNYNLGLGNQALTNQGQMQNFYTQQRGQDLQATGLGANLYGLGSQGQNQGIQDASSVYNPYTGYGSTVTGGGGTNYASAIGNGLATYQALSAR